MLDDILLWGVGAVIVAAVFWKFGLKAALISMLAVFGIRLLKQEREAGAADERAKQSRELEEVRRSHDEIQRKDHSPDDAYKHLRGLSRDRDD